MESEKVKEIKKVLESFAEADKQMTLWQNPIPNGEKHCIEIKYADILTLINELESENEKLTEERDLYKKRIAELDDLVAEIYVAVENARKETKEAEEYVKREISKLFTSFAERVKMEFYYEFDEIIPSIMSEKIDKILKEILGE